MAKRKDIEERKEGPRGNTKGAMKKHRTKPPLDRRAYLSRKLFDKEGRPVGPSHIPKKDRDGITGARTPPGYIVGQHQQGGAHLYKIKKGDKGHTKGDFYKGHRVSSPLAPTPRIPGHSRR